MYIIMTEIYGRRKLKGHKKMCVNEMFIVFYLHAQVKTMSSAHYSLLSGIAFTFIWAMSLR